MTFMNGVGVTLSVDKVTMLLRAHRRSAMAKLRHIAMVVEDIEKTAQFYEKSFEMKRVRHTPTAIGLSDGVVSLVLIDPKSNGMKGDPKRGVHHFGFVVDDVDAMGKTVEENGAHYH